MQKKYKICQLNKYLYLCAIFRVISINRFGNVEIDGKSPSMPNIKNI